MHFPLLNSLYTAFEGFFSSPIILRSDLFSISSTSNTYLYVISTFMYVVTLCTFMYAELHKGFSKKIFNYKPVSHMVAYWKFSQ